MRRALLTLLLPACFLLLWTAHASPAAPVTIPRCTDMSAFSRQSLSLLRRKRLLRRSGPACQGPSKTASSSSAMSRPAAPQTAPAAPPQTTITADPGVDEIPRRGAGLITLLSLSVHASCNDSFTLTGLVVTHEGSGSSFDIGSVHAALDDTIIGNGTPDERHRIWTIPFTQPLMLQACQQARILIRGDVPRSAQPGNYHIFTLRSPQDVAAGTVRFQAAFPLRGYRIIVR